MRKNGIAFIALAALFASVSPVWADITFPADATVHSIPAALNVSFHDGSTYNEIPGTFSADGPEAVRWFLKNTDDKFYGIFTASDLVAFQAVTVTGTYTFTFADKSQLQVAPNMENAEMGLAQSYLAKIREYEKTAPLRWFATPKSK